MSEMINITVTLSGPAAEAAPDPQMEYALVPPARMATLLELLGLRRPELSNLLPSCRVTVNGTEADRDTILADGDRVEIVSCP
jgi:hypothetical protein